MSGLAAPLTRTVLSGIQDLSTHRSILFMIRSRRTSKAWLTFCPFAALVSKYGILYGKIRLVFKTGPQTAYHLHKTTETWLRNISTGDSLKTPKAFGLFFSFVYNLCVFSKGVSSRISCTCVQIFAFPGGPKLAWHFPAPTLANNAGTAFLTNTWGKGSRTDGSKRGHTHSSLPGSGLLLHSLFSALSGHICCHTGWHLDFRSTHESVTDLRNISAI